MIQRLHDWLASSADKELRQRFKSEPGESAWNAWCELLRQRAKSLEIAEYAARLDRETEPAAEIILLKKACSLLLDFRKPTPAAWCDSLESLLTAMNSAVTVEVEFAPLPCQLLGELGLLLGLAFPELKPMKPVLEQGRRILADGLEHLLDGAGLPKSENLLLLRPLLACWTRSLFLGKNAESYPWKLKSQQQYEWAILQSLRLTRPDGSALFAPITLKDSSAESESAQAKKGSKADAYRKTLDEALSYDSDEKDKEVAQIVFSGKKTTARKKEENDPRLPNASFFSDWSRFGMLRADWSQQHPSLAVAYGTPPESLTKRASRNATTPFGGWTDSRVLAEFNFQSQPVFSGLMNVSVARNGKRLGPDGDWISLCEIHEPTHDYLELECFLGDGFRIQRHFFLAHDEEVMMIADSVLPRKEYYALQRKKKPEKPSQAAPRIEYELRIPLSPWIREQAGEPHGMERALFSTSSSKENPLLRILPLGLPEWDSDAASGELSFEEDSLVLRQFGNGVALFAPLFFEMNASRIRYPYTWRRLSVGEKLEKTSSDQAVGFRVQLHKNQYLLYRSLTEQRNRTVLGHNLVSDLFFGRFSRETGVETILEVEEE